VQAGVQAGRRAGLQACRRAGRQAGECAGSASMHFLHLTHLCTAEQQSWALLPVRLSTPPPLPSHPIPPFADWVPQQHSVCRLVPGHGLKEPVLLAHHLQLGPDGHSDRGGGAAEEEQGKGGGGGGGCGGAACEGDQEVEVIILWRRGSLDSEWEVSGLLFCCLLLLLLNAGGV